MHNISEFGSHIFGPSGAVGPTQFTISIPCPTNVNGVQGKLLTAYLKFRAGPPPIATIDNVRLMDGDIVVQTWPAVLPTATPGADYIATFQIHQNVTIMGGIALYFRVVELPGPVEILGAGIEIEY